MPLTAAWFCHSGHANSSRRGRGLEARIVFLSPPAAKRGRQCESRVCPHGPVSALQLSSRHCRLFPHLFWISPLSSLPPPLPSCLPNGVSILGLDVVFQRETPWQTIRAFCTLQKTPDARRPHIKFVTNFKLGIADHVAATSSLEAGGFGPTATTTTIQTKCTEQQLPLYYWQ